MNFEINCTFSRADPFPLIDYEYKGDDGVVRKMGEIESTKKVEAGGNSKAKKGSVGWVSKHLNDANSAF
jgi:hypothetical protein